MTMQERKPGYAPQLTPVDYSTKFGEFIGIGPNGNLFVDGCDVKDLADRFGTPLYIVSENQLRYTYRAFRDAFRRHYPDVEILFANKSNNGLAIRHIMNQEGAGGDCFGAQEMYMALVAGTNPKTLVLNGSNKQDDELEMAIANGLCINIDAMDELERIEAVAARLDVVADIGIRLKLDLEPLRNRTGVAMHGPGTLEAAERFDKVGHDARADGGDRRPGEEDRSRPPERDAFPSEPHVEQSGRFRGDGRRNADLVGLSA